MLSWFNNYSVRNQLIGCFEWTYSWWIFLYFEEPSSNSVINTRSITSFAEYIVCRSVTWESTAWLSLCDHIYCNPTWLSFLHNTPTLGNVQGRFSFDFYPFFFADPMSLLIRFAWSWPRTWALPILPLSILTSVVWVCLRENHGFVNRNWILLELLAAEWATLFIGTRNS